MASNQRGVPGIPLGALQAIKDENARLVLQAIVDGVHVRNGSTGQGDAAFVTRGELAGNGPIGSALMRRLASATSAAGSAAGGISPGQVETLLTELQAQVIESPLFKELGERIELIDTANAANGNLIKQETTDRANQDNAILEQTNTQLSKMNTSISGIQTTTNTTANTVAALSKTVTTLQSTVTNQTAALKTEAETRANADGTISAKYTVKVDVNGYVAGYGLISSANNSVPFSSFIVRADNFAIGSPSGPGIVTPKVPFIVRTTTTTLNGQTVPPGVYIEDAFIRNGVISSAKIGYAAIDTAHIRDLAVDTFKIKGNSITVPGFKKEWPNFQIGTYTTPRNFVSITLNFADDADVMVIANVIASNPYDATNVHLQLWEGSWCFLNQEFSTAKGFTQSHTTMGKARLAKGTRTINLAIGNNWGSGGPWTLREASLFVIGVMR